MSWRGVMRLLVAGHMGLRIHPPVQNSYDAHGFAHDPTVNNVLPHRNAPATRKHVVSRVPNLGEGAKTGDRRVDAVRRGNCLLFSPPLITGDDDVLMVQHCPR